ncbi:pyridoxamine 5'-phosphate oxidase family protein [Flagellimonas sp. CMM7]|uniref:pyridoxamine 5'-phosphate oxidase family protein n=1 Tax=Flagellimonas sp. CMM7 TaxID=2654676 RepID=UPI0013CF8D8A|nr:pyridoxamine 5'-phosphate oxidase family protein [Flagellimonas sp. CMM7]UII80463.1 pyridoxamine 5'-phosphate oxidase family protein [Flagellimonas sp. CMM7]
MGRQLDKLTPALIDFIKNQKLFFVATAMEEGSINLSPKGLDSLRVLDENRVVWLDLTGSGNETSTHLMNKNRITIMFCAFDGDPIILRLYGTAQAYRNNTEFWKQNIDLFPKMEGGRQLVDVKIDLIQVSCGMGVPIMEYKHQRQSLVNWAENQGNEGLKKYWKKKNSTSLDGYPTDITD